MTNPKSPGTRTWTTKDEIVNAVMDDYLEDYDYDNHPDPAEAMADIEDKINYEILLENQTRPRVLKIKAISGLEPSMIAQIAVKFYPIKNIICSGNERNDDGTNALLGVYMDAGDKEGIYSTSEAEVKRIIRKFDRNLSKAAKDEVISHLKEIAPDVVRCKDPNLVALKNGLFNYKAKTLEPFDRELVFIGKAAVDYNPFAQNVVIHNEDGTDFDIESWIKCLSDDEGVSELLWQVIGSTLRPMEAGFNRLINFYSMSGASGKSCITQIIRDILGRRNVASIPLNQMSARFALTPLLSGVTAIVNDENDVGSGKGVGYLEKCAAIKTIVTNDAQSIEVKFKHPVDYEFHGRVVNCQNSKIRTADVSDSFWRRQLWIPFSRNFSREGDKTYVKSDYLRRKDVLEYIVYRVLVGMADYYEFDVPKVCEESIEELKEYNDIVRQYWMEFRDVFAAENDVVPFGLLYDLFKAYCQSVNPSGTIKSYSSFKNELLEILNADSLWECKDPKQRFRRENHYDSPEHLIAEYDLIAWRNPTYTGPDLDVICTITKTNQTGITRK